MITLPGFNIHLYVFSCAQHIERHTVADSGSVQKDYFVLNLFSDLRRFVFLKEGEPNQNIDFLPGISDHFALSLYVIQAGRPKRGLELDWYRPFLGVEDQIMMGTLSLIIPRHCMQK